MLPGITEESEAQIARFLHPDITDLEAAVLEAREYVVMPAREARTRALGIEVVDGEEPMILVTDPDRPIGTVRMQVTGKNNVIAFDNAAWSGQMIANIRVLGSDSVIVMNDIGDGYVKIEDLLMRSNRQLLFWGAGASAVGVSLEIEGDGRSFVIGDDALISNGVWLRNYDMHAMHDLGTGAQINRPHCDTVLERHVWLGQDALLLSCERVGMGSIVGARAMVKGFVPRHAVAVGMPARVLREGISWGRSSQGMTAAERVSIGLAAAPGG